MKPDGSLEGRTLYRTQAGERKDLADTLKAERKEQRKDSAKAIRSAARELKSERKKLAKDQKQDRVKLKRTQEREVEKTHANFDKQRAKLDAKYEAQQPTAKDPEALDRAYARRKKELDAERAERVSDLSAEHRQARDEMRVFQKVDREQLRDEHRDRAEDARKEQRASATDVNTSARESISDLQFSHRGERAELRRDEQDAIRSDREDRQADDKSYSWVDAKATPDDGVPGAQAILDAVLEEMGHAEAWTDGSLDGMTRLKVLHEVRMAGRAWFRSEAQAVLDEVTGLEAKALFGAAKAKIGAFFGRAGKYVREIVAAGLLAVAGPGPMIQQEAIAEGYEQQVKIQAEYLADFRKQIVAEAKPLDGTFVARAEQYGNSAWSASQQIMRAFYAKQAIFDQEMREHRGDDRPCKTCREQVRLGWRPIGTLRSLGDSECKSGCHCVFWFRKGRDGEPHMAGRGPLLEAVFGVTR